MEIFHQSFQYTPSYLFDLMNLFYFYNLWHNFCSWMLKNVVIDRYMQSSMRNSKQNAQVCIFPIADLNACYV